MTGPPRSAGAATSIFGHTTGRTMTRNIRTALGTLAPLALAALAPVARADWSQIGRAHV